MTIRSQSFVALALVCAACAEDPKAPVTVRGVVVTQDGLPMPGALVSIAGASITADEEGTFEFTDVLPPYTVLVGLPGEDWSWGGAFIGLSRSDLHLRVPYTRGPIRSGQICGVAAGILEGGPVPHVLVESPWASGRALRNVSDGHYCGGVSWSGPESTAAVVHVLGITQTPVGSGSSWVASAFSQHATAAASLTDGASTEGVDLTLSSVGSSGMRATAIVPGGWTASLTADGFFGSAHTEGFPLAFVHDPQPWPAFAIPEVSGLRTHVWIWGTGSQGGTHVHRILDGPANLTVSVPLPPALRSPADETSSAGPGTTFRWDAMRGADLYLLTVTCDAARLEVHTGGAEEALPDFSAVGVALPRGASCEWEVVGAGRTGGVDRQAGPSSNGGVMLAQDSVSEDAVVGFVRETWSFTTP